MLLLGLVTLCACSSEQPETAAEESTPEAVPETAARVPDSERGSGMARLLRAYESGPLVPGVSGTPRYEHWAARVEAVMPDASEHDRVYLAKMLAIREMLSDRGPAAFSGLGVMHVHTRLLDAWHNDLDGDGVLSAEEIRAAADQGTNYTGQAVRAMADGAAYAGPWVREGPLTSDDITLRDGRPEELPPAFLVTADGDLDGAVSDDEWKSAYASFMNETEARERFITERLALHAYDADGDGMLGPEERAAVDGQPFMAGTGFSLENAWNSPILWTSLRGETPGLGWTRDWEVAPRYSDRPPLSLLEMPTEDTNGDGMIDFADVGISREEVDAYYAERRRRYIEESFGGLVRALDTDGDGAMSESEWESGHRTLPALERRNRFMHFYDVDRNGAISDAEVARFMDWYESGGLRADADFDGDVDHSDVAAFVEQVRSGP